ncbi:hypothetical protein [Faecalispora jeddahensis]|uniref:hypothetical protein n=1 Tax=Faecalispora jeddahensis TaxID=1414721 RepID=UPI0028A6B0B6|nr:hypothetical protein [Faecalispora jeddahensis]
MKNQKERPSKMDFMDGCTLTVAIVSVASYFAPYLSYDLSEGFSKSTLNFVLQCFGLLYFLFWIIVIGINVVDTASITLRNGWSYKTCFYYLLGSIIIQSYFLESEQVPYFVWAITVNVLINEMARHFLNWMEGIRNRD